MFPLTKIQKYGILIGICAQLRQTHKFMTIHRGVAQFGSASALGAEGRWFESSRPDQRMRVWFNGRTSAFQADDVGSIPTTCSNKEQLTKFNFAGCFFFLYVLK